MQLCPFSYDFPDRLRAQLLGIGAPEITEENLFDCRHLDLAERIRKAITSALGRCAVLELPQAEPTEGKEDTYALVHTVSVTLTIIRGSLCRVDTTAIAETLYRFFLTRHFRAVEIDGNKNFITGVVVDKNNTVVSFIRTKSSNYVNNKRHGKLLYKKR